MRHGKKVNHLGRTATHRKAMLTNMASSLILNKRITTTVAKAKELRKVVEPLITKSKTDNTHSRRMAFSYLQNKDSVRALFDDVAEKVQGRPGGYTRIIKTGNRLGDSAEMCVMELVDYNEVYQKEGSSSADAKPKTRRSRRAGSSKAKSSGSTEAKASSQKEAPAVEDAQVVEETTAEAPQAEDKKEEAPKNEATGDDASEEDKKA